MSVHERTLVRLAWCAWAAAIALVAAEVGMLLAVNYGFPGARTYDYGVVSIFAPVYATLGLVVATRRPRHPIGWLLMGCGLTIAMQVVAGQYAALAGAAALPGRLHGLWASTQVQSVAVGLLVLLLLLFPTGRALSPRWRPAVWSLVAGVSLTFVTQGLKPRTSRTSLGSRTPSAHQPWNPSLVRWTSLEACCWSAGSSALGHRWSYGCADPAAASASRSSGSCTSRWSGSWPSSFSNRS